MNRGWADAEVALHVGLGRRSSEHARIGVDEGQILALLFGEALPTGTEGPNFLGNRSEATLFSPGICYFLASYGDAECSDIW